MTRAILILLIVLVCVVQAGDRLRISLPGSVAQAPADVWVTIRLTPEPVDRALHFIVQGDPGEYRSSVWPLDGEQSWRIKQDWTKALGPGCYTFYAEVLDAESPRDRRHAFATIDDTRARG